MRGLILVILLATALQACTPEQTQEQPQEIICNSPYIRHADGCCLDEDSNSICDKDEITIIEEKVEEPKIVEEKEEETKDPVLSDKSIVVVLGFDFLDDVPREIILDEFPKSIEIQDIADGNELRVEELQLSFREIKEEYVKVHVYDREQDTYLFSGRIDYPNGKRCFDTYAGEHCLSYYRNTYNVMRLVRS